ncbi:MAG: hypothetical protein R3C10_04345 [Pirellulales bacterium]
MLDQTPLRVGKPIPKGVDRLQIVVVGAWTAIALLTVGIDVGLRLVGVEVVEAREAAAVDDQSHAGHRQLDVLLGIVLTGQALLKALQVFFEPFSLLFAQ